MATYREAPAVARFVCVVCYQSLSATCSPCPRCGVDRVDLARDDVRDDVRREAERRLARRAKRERLAIGAASTVIGIMFAVGAHYLLGAYVDDGMFELKILVLVGLMFAGITWPVLVRLYARHRPNAALATYAARRHRLARELGRDVQVGIHAYGAAGDQRTIRAAAASDEALARVATGTDPEAAHLNELLRLLGAKLDG